MKKGRTRLPFLGKCADDYFDAAGADAAAGTDAEAEAEAAAGLAFLSFFGVDAADEADEAAADAEAEAAAGAEALADAMADADADAAAIAELANRETTRAAMILDMFISFYRCRTWRFRVNLSP